MNQQKAVLAKLLEEVQRKNSWGKNELTLLIGSIMAEKIDRTVEAEGDSGDHKTPPQPVKCIPPVLDSKAQVDIKDLPW